MRTEVAALARVAARSGRLAGAENADAEAAKERRARAAIFIIVAKQNLGVST